MNCEKFNGPEPYVCNYQYSKLIMTSGADQGQTLLIPAVPLDSVNQLIITDTVVHAVIGLQDSTISHSMDAIGKIIFQ